MTLALLVALQGAQPAPDIQLDINATVREVRVRQSGEASLEIRAAPDGGSRVDVDAPESQGRRRLRNVTVRIRAEARIADPAANRPPPEPSTPQ